jgi:renalase
LSLSVAIVGAGLTGSLVAHQLSQAGFSTTLFEKSRGRGGRASTRQMSWGQFDLGVPLIPATDKHFIEFMDQLVGRAHRWPETVLQISRSMSTNKNVDSSFFVFDGKMNSICRYWLQSSHFKPNSLVTDVRYLQNRGWQLCIEQHWQETFFDVLICTAPWPQTKLLLEHANLPLTLAEQKWVSCWSIGIKLRADIKPQSKVIYLENNALQTLIFDSEKPNRPVLQDQQQIWVAQLNHQLSAILGKDGKAEAITLACDSLCQFFKLDPQAIQHTEGHFWRLARSEREQLPLGIIHHQNSNLIAGGDWSFGASVQSAFKASQEITANVLKIR